MPTVPSIGSRSRVLLRVHGRVQGVGFRPAVYRLAGEAGLAGSVRNDAGGVTIEIEGDEPAVSSFPDRLRRMAPAAARIDSIEVIPAVPRGDEAFRVEASASGSGHTEVAPDRATCSACLRELFDTAGRRHRYPFTTCIDCGPRYTIVRELPYDRPRTTMALFAMCEACDAEYHDPSNRRFHAETNACPACGPRLDGEAVDALRAGSIVAIKGLGGFHLAVDATNEAAVLRLRDRKQRPDKPFAVMVRDLTVAGRIAVLDDPARAALTSPAAPIVCVPKRPSDLAPSVAPRLEEVGVMLPYTPLHHLLLADGPGVLVMTSGNRSDEPVAIGGEALDQLAGIADVFLLHDRPIHRRADDSVVRIVCGGVQPLRRSRGFVPESIALPVEAPPLLALGAQLKNTIAVTHGASACLSPHIGDLSHPATLRFFDESIEAMTQLLGVEPVAVAHDLHPDYASTRRASGTALPRIAVQHHHAHVAACMAEHGRTGPVIGVAFDGTGCGPAGELWGGEILVATLGSFERVAHLRPLPLPGGEAAIREPWRLAAAALIDAGEPLDILGIDTHRLALIESMVLRGLNTPRATSAGRWFDAVAALCGLREAITFEAQAAMELEAIAVDVPDAYPFVFDGEEIDLRPMLRAIVAHIREGVPAAVIAGRFHETLARAVAAAAGSLRALQTVALSGGCFQNRRLTERTKALLERSGFEVLIHRKVPPNDGGIALGQAAVAAWRLASVGE